MLSLRNIALTQFKNYGYNSFTFKEKIVAICGENGSGKTNLLDAIWYCCLTKSHFSSSDQANTQKHKDGFRLQADFEKQGRKEEVVCIFRGNHKKEILLNGVPYSKVSEHIGHLPVVMVAPDDTVLISEGSDGRRKWIDTLLSQLNPIYLQQLIVYNKILLQRNSLLKNFDQTYNAAEILDSYNHLLTAPAAYIYSERKQLTIHLIPMVNQFYDLISGHSETTNITYHSQLHEEDLSSLLNKNFKSDYYLQRTTVGIHRDDLLFNLMETPFKQIASQGQRKSLLFALKLAEFYILEQHFKFAPILLLDDVFEKLDEKRMHHLIEYVCNTEAQVFITDTHHERLQQTFNKTNINAQMIEVNRV